MTERLYTVAAAPFEAARHVSILPVGHRARRLHGHAPLVLRHGQELKLVYPQAQPEARPEHFIHLDFQYFLLQLLDGPHLQENTQAALRYCLEHPQWRLSLQTHKILHIP